MITTEIFTYGDRLILDFELMLLPSSISKGAKRAIGDYCYKNVTLHIEPAEIRTRFFKTRHFIVDIEVIESSNIWKVFTQVDNSPLSDEDLEIVDHIDPLGIFFKTNYEEMGLSKLIEIHMRRGWRLQEVVNSVNKLAQLDPSELVFDSDRKAIAWLKREVNQQGLPTAC
ncbi:MAG: hypothetical protein DSM106950_37245 [Stigonema ocellatum SAG 48.90 = DSM 106950]|nr:hypothetical protein [Stigonema ocellatum SAG 48.90 = DSM 106950]